MQRPRRPTPRTRARRGWLAACLIAGAALTSGACGGAQTRDVDPQTHATYEAWVAAGRPRASGASRQHALEGRASWYGERHHGNTTASGEPFDMYAMTAAHPTLPFGTLVEVERADSRATVLVRINDRGPFVRGRVIDLSYAAADRIGMVRAGVVPVSLRVVRLGDGRRSG